MSSLLLLASAAPAAPATENREASPIALVLVLVLLVALVFLIRSMNKHLRKIPSSFSKTDTPAEPVGDKDPTT
jgi:FtsH-binding integral membrane protein